MDRGLEQCAIITAAVDGWDATALKLRLRERGINVDVSLREAGILDMDEKGLALGSAPLPALLQHGRRDCLSCCHSHGGSKRAMILGRVVRCSLRARLERDVVSCVPFELLEVQSDLGPAYHHL